MNNEKNAKYSENKWFLFRNSPFPIDINLYHIVY